MDIAMARITTAFAYSPDWMVEEWKLEDSSRQFGDHLERLVRSQFQEVPFTDQFKVGVDISLLSEITERVRVSDAQLETDLDVFEKVDPVAGRTAFGLRAPELLRSLDCERP